MSVKRIESAYAYYLNNDKMSGTQMAVLQALAYCANEKDHEKCYPSVSRLAKLTHFAEDTVDNAKDALRKMGVITWKKGGQIDGMNVPNFYTFLFPRIKMTSSRERYEKVMHNRNADAPSFGVGSPTTCPPVPQPMPPGTPPDGEGVPHQMGSNTECNLKFNPQLNSESKPTPQPSFDFGSVLKCVNKGSSTDPRMATAALDEMLANREQSSPIQAAMCACGVTDQGNMRTFSHYGIQFGKKNSVNTMWEVIDRFAGEIKDGEHDGLDNRASELTKRFKKALQAISLGPE